MIDLLKSVIIAACALGMATSSCVASSPILRNEVGQLTWLRPVRIAPDIGFSAIDGTPVNLRRFRGKIVVLNFWATWCLPCVRELPSLERLQKTFDQRDLAVVAVSIDKQGQQIVAPFLRARNLTDLHAFLDPNQRLGHLYSSTANEGSFALYGLPISYILDRAGHVTSYIVGATDWDSGEARKALLYFVKTSENR